MSLFIVCVREFFLSYRLDFDRCFVMHLFMYSVLRVFS